jgi:hypothetical protein
MSDSIEQNTPIIFISYSHDTREHKAWVALLAQRLVEKGVEVLFDQWDLGPGDDVPKFMEHVHGIDAASADHARAVCAQRGLERDFGGAVENDERTGSGTSLDVERHESVLGQCRQPGVLESGHGDFPVGHSQTFHGTTCLQT